MTEEKYFELKILHLAYLRQCDVWYHENELLARDPSDEIQKERTQTEKRLLDEITTRLINAQKTTI